MTAFEARRSVGRELHGPEKAKDIEGTRFVLLKKPRVPSKKSRLSSIQA